MIRRFIVLAFALLAAGEADTLRLRNGALVKGTWLGGTAGEVRFMVDDQVKRYPRADVAGVDFNSDGVANPIAPIAPIAPPAAAQPDVAGVPFLRGASGLITLESEIAMISRSGTMYGMGGPSVYRIPGPQSPVRVRRGDRIVIVVRLNPGNDPRRFEVYALESGMNYRQTQPVRGGRPPALPMTISQIGDSVYEISPTRPLYPGEYSVSPIDSNRSYCFGVDY